jgi:hypothetical protein
MTLAQIAWLQLFQHTVEHWEERVALAIRLFNAIRMLPSELELPKFGADDLGQAGLSFVVGVLGPPLDLSAEPLLVVHVQAIEGAQHREQLDVVQRREIEEQRTGGTTRVP